MVRLTPRDGGKATEEERDRRNECVGGEDSGRNRQRGRRLLDWKERIKGKEKGKDRIKGRE